MFLVGLRVKSAPNNLKSSSALGWSELIVCKVLVHVFGECSVCSSSTETQALISHGVVELLLGFTNSQLQQLFHNLLVCWCVSCRCGDVSSLSTLDFVRDRLADL